MTDNILADIPKEGEDPFKELETDTPAESPTVEIKEEVPAETQKPEEKEVPFHEHPRWIAHQKELEELRAFKEEVTPKLEELTTRTPDTTTTVPDWFKELYGDNVQAYQKLQAHEQQTYQEIEQRVLNAQEARKQQELQELAKWNGWVENEVNRLKSEGKSFERNELLKVMLDYRPSDDKGNFDFTKGYGIYEALKAKEVAPKSEARKKLGDMASTSTKGESPKKDYLTAAELRNTSMSEL